MTRPADVDARSFMLGRLEALEWVRDIGFIHLGSRGHQFLIEAIADARAQVSALTAGG